MRYSSTPLSLDIGAGVLIGFGLSGSSFNLVLSAFSKLLPPERRGVALGAGTAAGSFGQFLFAPFGVAMIDNFGWQTALTVFAGLMLLIVPLAFALSTPPTATTSNVPAADNQSFKTALAEAFGHRSYVLPGARLLHLRLPACLHHRASAGVPRRPRHPHADRRLGARCDRTLQHHRFAQRRLCAELHSEALHPLGDLLHARAVDPHLHLVPDHHLLGDRLRCDLGPDLALHGAADLGAGGADVRHALVCHALWLAFVSHQVGGFLGVWLGGIVFEKFGSYTPIWWLSILFGVLSALINLPIVEKPVDRTVAQPA
jgi:MFS family permease